MHQILDYLNMSVNCPLNYSPSASLSSAYSKNLRDLLQHKRDIIRFEKSAESRDNVFRALIKIFVEDSSMRLQSDSTHDFYMKNAGVVNMQSQGDSFCNSK